MDALRLEIAANYKNGYSQMPDQVRQDRTLSPKAKIVYEQLLSYMWFKSERCFPSQQTIADATGYSRRSVIRALTELYERGYIEKWRRGQGYTNYYFINPLLFPHSFKRSVSADAATMLLPTSAPELRQDVTTTTPPSIDAALTMCQAVTSRSDNEAHTDAPGSHPKQTKTNGKMQGEEISSNSSTAEKGTAIAAVTIRTDEQPTQPNELETKPQLLPKSKPQSNEKEQAGPPRAKAVKNAKDEIQTKQYTQTAAITETIGIPAEHLAELGIAPQLPKRPTPVFLTDIITRYSRELGDSARSSRSNITRATKLYYFASDCIKDAQDDPQRFFLDLLYEAKQAAYKVDCIQHRSASNNPNRIPVFFTCLENFFELTPEERAYIRSEAPLIAR
jgi:DNA-binding transcriptional ArsR family regulator